VLAAATVLNNAVSLLFTVVFTRVLGATDYGTLAALISAVLILVVAGQAIQAAVAREAALERLGTGEALGATLRSWTLRILAVLALVGAVSIALREPLAELIGVGDAPWAAAAVPPTGVLWVLLSLQRGALQGLAAYGAVSASIAFEGLGRLGFALVLVAAGLGVTGALLGTPLAIAAVAGGLEVAIRRRLGPVRSGRRAARSLGSVAAQGRVPIAGLLLLAVLQNVDVIVAKHQMSGPVAGSYAAAAVAAKSVVWVAIGIGLFVLPEAARRAAAGADARPVLLRSLGILVAIAAPALILFAAAPDLILGLAFGDDLTAASRALLLVGAAMTLLAVAYLTVQYLLGLHDTRFLPVLALIAVAEPFLLLLAGERIVAFAAIVLAVQCAAAGAMLVLALLAPRPRRG
jgi:O-antigen/teichoic acid export membrane protein